MSENKCPFCGEAMITTEDKIMLCENSDCATMFNEWDYPKVAAAMECQVHHQAMVEAVRPLVEYYKWLEITEEDAFEPGEIIIGSSFQGVTKEQLDALAALVGEG